MKITCNGSIFFRCLIFETAWRELLQQWQEQFVSLSVSKPNFLFFLHLTKLNCCIWMCLCFSDFSILKYCCITLLYLENKKRRHCRWKRESGDLAFVSWQTMVLSLWASEDQWVIYYDDLLCPEFSQGSHSLFLPPAVHLFLHSIPHFIIQFIIRVLSKSDLWKIYKYYTNCLVRDYVLLCSHCFSSLSSSPFLFCYCLSSFNAP